MQQGFSEPEYVKDKEELRIRLLGEIDHHNAVHMRGRIDELISEYNPKRLVLEMAGVNLMDSSGLGLIMGRVNVMRKHGGRVVLWHPCAPVLKICSLAGLERIVEIQYEEKKA